MITPTDYEKIAGYMPAPGRPCPECKAVCTGGGPDHHPTCQIMSRLWSLEKNPNESIPRLPGIDPNDPLFGPWAAKLASGFFSQPVAIPKSGPPMPPPNAPVAVPEPLKA